MKDEIKEILDYFNKEISKYEESKTYLMETYGYREEDIDKVEQHKKYVNLKQLSDYITNLQGENERLKEVVENLTTLTVYGDRKQIKNTAQYKLEIAQERIDKANWWLKEMLKQAKSEETKAIINGTLELLLTGGDEE